MYSPNAVFSKQLGKRDEKLINLDAGVVGMIHAFHFSCGLFHETPNGKVAVHVSNGRPVVFAFAHCLNCPPIRGWPNVLQDVWKRDRIKS